MPPKKVARVAVERTPGPEPEATEASGMTTHLPATRKQLRGKRGRLRDMPNMPMDILLEVIPIPSKGLTPQLRPGSEGRFIFSHLLPLDLLNLARTSKPFRALLMARSSAGLWKASRRLVEGLPECPAHLSEPAYANLVFCSHCHSCLKPITQSMLWVFGVRYCSSCKKSLTVSLYDDNARAEFISDHFGAVYPLLNKTDLPGKKHTFYHVPQVDEVKKAWDELGADQDKWSQYEQEQRQRVKEIEKAAAFAIHCVEVARHGLGEELDKLPNDMHPLADHTHVRPAKEITERAWERIRDDLSSYMQYIQDIRLARERSAVTGKRLELLSNLMNTLRNRDLFGRGSHMELHPKFPDYALMPEFRELVEVPSDRQIETEELMELCHLLPTLRARWLLQRMRLLGKMLATALGLALPEGIDAEGAGEDSTNIPYDMFDLAVAVFECRHCCERMTVVNTISHRCARSRIISWFLQPNDDQPDADDCYLHQVRTVSPANDTYVWENPETVTAEEMLDLDVRLVVKDILVEGRRKVMTWAAAVYAGQVDDTVRESDWQFEILSEEDKSQVAELELKAEAIEAIMPAVLESDADYWCCALCDEMVGTCTYPAILDHMVFEHDKWEEDLDECAFLHPDIFSHLLPADLLNLARTSKPFRTLLMTRSSATLWKISRRLVDGLPDCPVHLSEPAYANLIFSPYCHNCMKPNTQSITWEFLIRYCSSCKKSMWDGEVSGSQSAREVSSTTQSFLSLSLTLLQTEIRGKVFYHVRQIEQVKQKWDESHANEDKWSQYVREQRQRVQAIQDLAQACTLWATKRANIRAQELDQIRQRRLEFIVSKLRDMGWGEELDMLPSDMLPLADHAHVRLSKDITERGWEKIRDEVASVMQHNKDLRMARERSAVLRERLQTLASVISATRDVFGRSPATESCPKFPDYALMPQFRALVEAPNEERIDEEAFKDLRTALPTLDARWKAEQVSLLQNMLAKALGRIPEGGSAEVEGQGDPLDHPYADLFHLAMAVFECQRCFTACPGSALYPTVVHAIRAYTGSWTIPLMKTVNLWICSRARCGVSRVEWLDGTLAASACPTLNR
ncbi:uncharacterized protein B0H18DRAFT_1122178 [Fomitopsis serialis]|uniref:uncharacterized protein n=1 Tax=Fomitopsis serialis TaxID=139415 RepID=UPI002007A73E|nr:uncharacterized protein B0H18DRAFT_1122178 [Neoantrodia serialis]KAH9920083.1 hypothetical protein B0H18DRAFT_1122178 [Neoantrodia serialis]